MLNGKSVWHVNQSIGTCFNKDTIRGYYNDLTEKVTIMPSLLYSDDLPLLPLEDGSKVEMPVAIFQYGLGAYDMYIREGEDKYMKKFRQSVDWAISHLDAEGRWSNFFYIYPDNPFGAMAQGEGASLLLRAYSQLGDKQYLEAAKRAIDYMLKPIPDGGTTLYNNDEVIFAEYTHLPFVMNGWIFAWWGLYDFVLVTNDKGRYSELLEQSCNTLEKYLPRFNTNYWSKYDLAGKIASPFYHNLHIAQMQAMYQLTENEVFNKYANRWERQQRDPICKTIAFVKKAFQKLAEKKV